MSVWSTRRQLNHIFLFVVIVLVIAIGVFLFVRKPSSCTDSKKNQGELDTDCGGPCVAVCPSETTDVIVLWTRSFPVRPGIYNAVSFLRNPNRFGADRLEYNLKLYDKDNLLVREVSGETYINPEEEFPIVENNISVGARVPVRAILEISSLSPWRRVKELIRPDLAIRNKEINRSPRPTVTATIANNSLFDVGNITVVAVVLDSSGNAAAGSSTFVDSLPVGETRDLVFTWPEDFSGAVSLNPPVDIYARVNLAELSGN